MAELAFTLRLSSPAFSGSVPRGTKTVHCIVRGQPTTASVDYYPVDPRGLRIPSLRGLLAFWHRSLLGGQDGAQVFAAQAEVFGSTGQGQGLRILPVGRPAFKSGPIEFTSGFQPFLYLGYGPIQILKRPDPRGGPRDVATSWNRNACRDAILVPPKGEWPRFQFLARGTREQVAALRRSLVLLHLFGGIGSRARRGWGSVEVEMDGLAPPARVDGVKIWFEATLASAWEGLAEPASRLAGQPAHSAFSAHTRIRLTGPHGGYEEVLRELYRRFQQVRLWRLGGGVTPHRIAKVDHDLERRDALAKRVTGIPQRLAFGMPYHPASRSGPERWDIRYQRDDEETRRASPLLLKVLRVGPSRYVGVCLFLEARFFGRGSLDIGAKNCSGKQPFPGYQAVKTYLDNPDWTPIAVP